MLKQSTVAVPDLIARVMTGFPVERVESWRPKARERTREALETAKCVSAWKSDPVFGVIGVQN